MSKSRQLTLLFSISRQESLEELLERLFGKKKRKRRLGNT